MEKNEFVKESQTLTRVFTVKRGRKMMRYLQIKRNGWMTVKITESECNQFVRVLTDEVEETIEKIN
nr:MAG: hypothetical protein [Microviridae sp.]